MATRKNGPHSKELPDIPKIFETALQHHRAGRPDAAKSLCQEILTLDPRHADSLHYLGATAYKQGRYEEAVDLIGRAVQLKEDVPYFHFTLALALKKAGKLDKAAACYERVLAINPNNSEACNNLGCSYEELGRLEEALVCYSRALAIRPDYAEAQYNIGAVLYKQGKFDDSLACCERALVLSPDYAEAHYFKANIHLTLGDFDTGWRENEWRWRTKYMTPPKLAAPLWDGKNLEGRTILLHCEQGLGDSIQFIRYSRLVKEKTGRVLLCCPPSLVKLFSGAEGIDEILTSEQLLPNYDCHAPLLSLPYLLGTTLNTIPASGPYLHPDPAQVKVWKNRLAEYSGFRAGIVWRGRPTHKNDRERSMSPAQFGQFLDLPGISVVSLQKDGTEEEMRGLGIKDSFFNAGPLLNDFSDTAACLVNLDLVITVDTSVCHLAGALGVPVWSLIPFAPDWRWLLKRNDSPWYPSMRLFRQPAIRNWQSVLGQVRDDLIHMLENKQSC